MLLILKKFITIISLLFTSILLNRALAQRAFSLKQNDTLSYQYQNNSSDTSFVIREVLDKNIFKQTTFYGRKNNEFYSNIDTFAVTNSAWEKLYNNIQLPYLSIKDFKLKKQTFEYIDKIKKERDYLEYTPVKKIVVGKKKFYVYRVRPMSGGGLGESLGDNVFYVVFDFSIGEVYRTSFQTTKVLEGYEKYLKYFFW